MSDLQIYYWEFGMATPAGIYCDWVACAVEQGFRLTWVEELVRDLMLAGY